MENIFKISEKNHNIAWEIIDDTDIFNLWNSEGARVNIVGSLITGLMMKHRDIDLHIYSKNISMEKAENVMKKLAAHKNVKTTTIVDLTDTEEKCLECHAIYTDNENQNWQLDMIYIEEGSRYDGYFEHVSERIKQVLTPKTRETILKLKYETPDDMKIPGIEYYKAVIEDGITTFHDFLKWRNSQNHSGIIEWCP